MSVAKHEPPQHEPVWVDTAISRLLRFGVVSSILVITIGLVLTFLHHPEYLRSRTALGQLTEAEAMYPHHLADVVRQVGEGRGQAIVMLGLLLLIATPVARVAFSIVAFAVERDRLYIVITSVVLLALLVSFVIGAAG